MNTVTITPTTTMKDMADASAAGFRLVARAARAVVSPAGQYTWSGKDGQRRKEIRGIIQELESLHDYLGRS